MDGGVGASCGGSCDRGDGVSTFDMQPDRVLEIESLAYRYPDGHQALYGIDLAVERGELSRCSVQTVPGRRRWCSTATACSPRNWSCSCGRPPSREGKSGRDPPPSRDRVPRPRRPALHADRLRRRGVRPDQLRCAYRRSRRACRRGVDRRRDDRVRAPNPAPPELWAAPSGRDGERARLPSGAAGARRAVVEPRPREVGASSPTSCTPSRSLC